MTGQEASLLDASVKPIAPSVSLPEASLCGPPPRRQHQELAAIRVVEKPTTKVVPYDFIFFLILFVISTSLAVLLVTTVTDLYTPPVLEEPIPLQQVEPAPDLYLF